MNHRTFRQTPVAKAVALALGIATVTPMIAHAQEEELQEVVVTGIRGSLTSSMNLKRNAQGVVDGISSEDIGKFPDTNLAESLQRITGVSIDRQAGEGQRVTVRGLGPDFNLVLLNGRQMPASSLEATSAPSSRAFDFGNLASEAVTAVEVYKTSLASTPTGGIGATINIKTTRPLESPGRRLSFGIKGVTDKANDNLPSATKGSSWTPEISGIYSDTFADNRFGVSITASYQDRAGGYNQVQAPDGYTTYNASDAPNWGTINPASPGAVTNAPRAGSVYSTPQSIRYDIHAIKRKRTNGQLTLQYQPVDSVTATLDYTYSELKLATKRNELSAWFNFGPAVSKWTDGPVASPLFYSEIIGCAAPGAPGCADVAMAISDFASRNENKSLGFNLKWDATDRLGFELDVHSSSGESGRDSPFGSNNVIGAAGFFRGTTSVDFTQDFPVLSITLPASMNGRIDPAFMQATGSSFRNSYMKSEVNQAQVKGDWKFGERSRLDFGVSLTDVKNRSAFSNVQQDAWGGLATPAAYPDSIWIRDTVAPYFGDINGSNSSALFNQFFTFDFNALRTAAAAAAGNPALFVANPNFANTDRNTQEKTNSGFVQYSTGSGPFRAAVGVRFEKTDVTAKAVVPVATGTTWVAANEIPITFGPQGTTTLKGSYNFWLPSLDGSVDLSDNIKARASWGKSIGRPTWDNIQGGQSLNALARVAGGSGSQGNPGLKPLESENLDLSLEWYYGKGSYASVGFFKKHVVNFVGTGSIQATPFNLPNPAQGPWVADAIRSGCASTDFPCIRTFIFTNHATDPAVNVAAGTIKGRPGIDPAMVFNVTVPSNQRSDSIEGWEVAVQHMFGDSGFGLSANYTFVTSGLKFNNASTASQFALPGLGDSANIVGFYEKNRLSVRVAYNWRDQFFDGVDSSNCCNPVVNPENVAPYGQIDATIGFNWSDNLSFQAEVINAASRVVRQYERAYTQFQYVTQTGPRYMIGARYKFDK